MSQRVHKKRLKCVIRFVSSLLTHKNGISLTEIGNNLSSNTSLKHKIKAADYFVGNEGLAKDIPNMFKGFADFFFGQHTNLIINVDWSGACTPGFHILQASVTAHGRSVAIYNEVHSEQDAQTEEVHNAFLDNLKETAPPSARVTIVTDAGFHRNWFSKVSSLGWDYIGRVYSRYYYRPLGQTQWSSLADISFDIQGKASSIGKVELGKTEQSLTGFMYTYKEKISNKAHKKNKYPYHEKRHSDSYRDGWVLISSLDKPASQLISTYKKRMQIEQNFRDVKSEVYGTGLRRHKSKGLIRTTMLHFLVTIINIILWWIGLAAEDKKISHRFQSNTTKNKRVVSFVSLARMVLCHEPSAICWFDLKKVIDDFCTQYLSFIQHGVFN